MVTGTKSERTDTMSDMTDRAKAVLAELEKFGFICGCGWRDIEEFTRHVIDLEQRLRAADILIYQACEALRDAGRHDSPLCGRLKAWRQPRADEDNAKGAK